MQKKEAFSGLLLLETEVPARTAMEISSLPFFFVLKYISSSNSERGASGCI
jgi:hypothetical protein